MHEKISENEISSEEEEISSSLQESMAEEEQATTTGKYQSQSVCNLKNLIKIGLKKTKTLDDEVDY